MIGLDTNVLVRFLTQDDPRQSATANHLIRNAKKRGEPIFLNLVVLCELVWVLESAYRHSRAEVSDVLERLLLTIQFEVEDRDSVYFALSQYRVNDADFSDYLIGRRNIVLGCNKTVTFDRDLEDDPSFTML